MLEKPADLVRDAVTEEAEEDDDEEEEVEDDADDDDDVDDVVEDVDEEDVLAEVRGRWEGEGECLMMGGWDAAKVVVVVRMGLVDVLWSLMR